MLNGIYYAKWVGFEKHWAQTVHKIMFGSDRCGFVQMTVGPAVGVKLG